MIGGASHSLARSQFNAASWLLRFPVALIESFVYQK
jgi:hypothetical protein